MLTSPSKFLTGTIFLHAHLLAVYYNCVKFHLNPMSRLGGVALTSSSLHTERISEYKLNYPPFQILDSNHIPSCTSAGSVLQLCKVSEKFNKLFMRSCAYKVHALLLFVKVQVELSPLPNVGQRSYFFMHICR